MHSSVLCPLSLWKSQNLLLLLFSVRVTMGGGGLNFPASAARISLGVLIFALRRAAWTDLVISTVQGTAKSSSSTSFRLFVLDFQCPLLLVLLSDPWDDGDSLSLYLFTLQNQSSSRDRSLYLVLGSLVHALPSVAQAVKHVPVIAFLATGCPGYPGWNLVGEFSALEFKEFSLSLRVFLRVAPKVRLGLV
ncbi:hypothetical protein Tco_1530126 [Tanacetum coccineum]